MKSEKRIEKHLAALKKKKVKAFCPFITLGCPNFKTTEKLLWEFEKMGVDIIELGIPFSDPLADGPVIQQSSEIALKNGANLSKAFQLLKKMRAQGFKSVVICFTYFNPVYQYGLSRFVQNALSAGFDGVIIPDLIPGEETGFEHKLAHDIFMHKVTQFVRYD